MNAYPGAISARLVKAPGKPWSGGSGNRKLVLHSTETTGLPSYTSPPHLTAKFSTSGPQVFQHVPFDLAAYSIRSSAAEQLRFVYQVELVGYAATIPAMPDWWYDQLGVLIDWFVANLAVPRRYADFSRIEYGRLAPARMTTTELDAFSGILGHGHVGKYVDTHWNPGKLRVDRLPAPPPPPPPGGDPDDEYEENMDTPDWVRTLRPKDIDRAVSAGSIEKGEANYWKNGNPDPAVPFKGLSTPDDPEWENYRRAVVVRRV